MARPGYMFKRTFTRHPERSEAKSKDPVALIVRVVVGFLDFARNDRFSVLFPALLFPNQ